jgi:hypothetical protein
VSKILIEESDVVDPASMKVLEDIARFFNRLEDPYRMPSLMADWLRDYNGQHKVDTTYRIPVGYSHNALALDFVFKTDMMVMTFNLPDGTRLMELRLHV